MMALPDFRYYPLRFELIARQRLVFPRGKAANTLRGALGLIFRSLACTPECRGLSDTRLCPVRSSCPYARAFEPKAGLEGPSGLHDRPRPFVFRARHLEGRTLQPGERFYFDLNLFTADAEIHRFLVLTFASLAEEGLGPARSKVDLVNEPGLEPVVLSFREGEEPIRKLRVDFVSPTELKHEGEMAEHPEFPILMSRIRDRIAMLQAFYGEGPLDLDFRAMGQRAEQVEMTECEISRGEVLRRSTRTGQVHSLGGFKGFAVYEGNLSEFVPWVQIACHTGVGRQAVWGKGELSVRLQGCGREHW